MKHLNELRDFKPPKANRTKQATVADKVYTPEASAQWIINHFQPKGSILDPSAGYNAFYDNFPNKEKYRCEIEEGSDFFEWTKHVDWIITNPPYSIYDDFLEKAFEVADNVVFFVPLGKAFKSNRVQRMVMDYGGLKELVYMGGGQKHGFPFGFPVGCLYYKKGYKGDCKITNVL